MEEVKRKVTARLTTLREIKFVKPTAMDLHSSRPLTSRVQRNLNLLYKQRVLKQQKEFQLKLARINKYHADFRAEEKRRREVLKAYAKLVEPDYPAPVFQPISLVVPKPSIHVPGAPVQRWKRIHRRRRLKKLKRVK